MATISSTAAGNWGSTATWVGGVLPGLGDTAKLQHQVTLDANYSVGGIDPTGVGCLISTGSSNRLAVGGAQIAYIAKGIITT